MRAIEAVTAAFLFVLALPVFVVGWTGTIVAGERPMFRRRVVWREGESREMLEFNSGHGELGLAFRRSAIASLPTLLWVLAGRMTFQDFIRWGDCR